MGKVRLMSPADDRIGHSTSQRSLHSDRFDSDDLGALLQRVAVMAAKAPDVDASVGLTVIRDGEAGTVAASDDRAATLDEVQYGIGDGPCLHAARTGQIITVSDLDTEPLWPDAITAARRQGVRCSLSVPLVLRDATVGALNVYAFDQFDFTADSHRAVFMALCVEASVAISLELRREALTTQVNHLEAAMATRKVIDQAVGIMMAKNGCSADEAFAHLRRASQNRNVKLRDIAAELVHRVSGTAPDRVDPSRR